MRNLIEYKNNCFEFYNNVVINKHFTHTDPKFKDRLRTYEQDIIDLFSIYGDKFYSNKLEELQPFGFDEQAKQDLLKLYKFSRKMFRDLKLLLTTDNNKRVSNTCQNCTIGEVSSLDHFLPKEEFVEFVANPINLFPSCTKCNSKKSVNWRTGGKRSILNLYIDLLPDVQYLFVDIDLCLEPPDLRYFLNNRNNIDRELFDLIEVHYARLDLFQRFRENSHKIISELDREIKRYLRKNMPIDDIVDEVKNECLDLKEEYGQNYWKAILKISLVENQKYIERYEQ